MKEPVETIVHQVFPVAVIQEQIDIHQSFKKEYFEDLKTEWFNGYENESPENSGKSFIHLNEKYVDFFKSLKKSVNNYLTLLGVDTSKVNLHVTKSWVGYHNKDIPPLKIHNHNASDISFCYYLQCDETSDKFCVHPYKNYNEVSGGLFEVSDQNPILNSTNYYNCDSYGITPVEGSVLIFPSSLAHSTIKQANVSDRYVIAGDIKLTLKPEYYNHMQSIPHPSQWLDLEEYKTSK